MNHTNEHFLETIPVNYRGSFKNIALCHGPRAGVTDPDEISERIRCVLSRRSDQGAVAMARAMDTSPGELRVFLVAIRNHDSQPEEVRLRKKQAARQDGVDRWMATQPVSSKQTDYLIRLGYRGPQPSNMADASALIQRLRNGGGRP